MKCPSCNKETRGIKLSGKVFCTYCGDVIKSAAEVLEEFYEHQDRSEEKRPDPKRPPVSPPKEINFLDAAKRSDKKVVVEKHPEEEKPKVVQKKIIKHNRNRAGMTVLKNEPDPITQLEIESPHDSQLEPPSKKQTTSKNKKASPKVEKKKKKPPAPQKPKRKKAKPKEKTRPQKRPRRRLSIKKAIMVTAIAAVIVSSFLMGLIFYINNYVKNEDDIKEGLEATPEFEFRKIENTPPGYELSSLSKSEKDRVEYRYTKAGGEETIIFRATKKDIETEKIYEDLVSSAQSDHLKIAVKETEVWVLEQKMVSFEKDGVFYEIEFPEGTPFDEIREIIEEVIS